LYAAIVCLSFLSGSDVLGASSVLSVDFTPARYFEAPLFSFTYDGHNSADLLPQWKAERSSRKLDRLRTEHRLVWTDPATGLEVRCVGIAYRDFPAVEWTVYFKNTGTANTPLLEGIQGIDLTFQRNQDAEFILHGTKGDWCAADSYKPFDQTLEPNSQRQFAPYGGRPNSGAFPYYICIP
jgi:alpha-galactosidase